MAKRALVTGAGGFIGHHLVKHLQANGYWVRGVDIKPPEYEPWTAEEFEVLDLRRWDNCLVAPRGIEEVYHLAADMGGIGYITAFHAEVARNIGLFSHDSDHGFDDMLWEFRAVWPRLAPGGLLLSDDGAGNNAFREFCRSHRSSCQTALGRLGVARKS